MRIIRIIDRSAIAICASVALLLARSATAVDLYVDPNGSDGADGLGWLNDTNGHGPFKTLQRALEAAAATEIGVDTIRVAKGTYLPTGEPDDETASFVLISQCVIEGGYKGGTDDPNDRKIADYETVLSGDIADDDGETSFDDALTAENSDHIVYVLGVGDDAEIEGFTITQGRSTDATLEFPMVLEGDPPEWVPLPCWEEHVPAKEGGAAIDCLLASPKIRFCTFRHNWSTLGGAVRVLCESDPQIVGCLFDDNKATPGGEPPGGAGSGGGHYMQGFFARQPCSTARSGTTTPFTSEADARHRTSRHRRSSTACSSTTTASSTAAASEAASRRPRR